MHLHLTHLQTYIFNKLGISVSHFENDAESSEYEACRFRLNHNRFICRTAKLTPKKAGQFVTFWKRSEHGPIAPFHELDSFDFFMVIIINEDNFGIFVIPKSILTQKGIVSTNKKEGKRAFRVYAPWDKVTSKQAEKSQKWQSDYFHELKEGYSPDKIAELLSI